MKQTETLLQGGTRRLRETGMFKGWRPDAYNRDTSHSDHSFALIQAGLDNIDQGITIFDGDLRLVFANVRIQELLDVPPHIMRTGVDFEEVIRFNAERGEYGPGDVEKLVAERVAAARQFVAHTLERIRPNGVVLKVSGWPLDNGGFATIYTDVTDQRRREETLESLVSKRTEDLRRNEERLRLIANEVPAGIAYIDCDKVFEFVNARFASAYQTTPDELIGRSANEIMSAATMAIAGPNFERARRGEAVDFDMTIRLKDRPEMEVRTFLRPDGGPNSGIHGFYVLSVNVTKQKRAEAALSMAQKMEAVGQLSSGVAHDFNNLLAVILGNLTPVAAELRESGATGSALANDMLDPAIRAARRGADLTARLLAVARRQPVEARPVDIGEAIQNLAKLVSASLPERVKLDLETRAGGAANTGHWAEVDPTQLETALLNLAMNARDAIPAGSAGQVRISLRTRRLRGVAAEAIGLAPGDYVEIAVADNGVGVPPDARSRIFEPFFSTKTDRGGSGLGLALVYSFAQEAGGQVNMTSSLGKGSRFALLLPAVAPGLATPDDRPVDETPLSGRLVLLVEDDAGVRRVLTRMLCDLGMGVLEAEDVEEAQRLLAAVPDVSFVLSDIAMPGDLNGADLAEQLADERPDLPVALMTAHGRDRLPGATHRFQGPVLRKPFERAALVNAFAAAEAAAQTENK
ncbi:MAG: PAS-domain containing protein [Neomegalonema sp.]|nr:PAS-domain containing protein [Neomegalonema sp.]